MKKKLVILVAPNGGNAFDREGAHVPITPEEIAEETVRCREAGASVVHIHARQECTTSTLRYSTPKSLKEVKR